MEKLKAWTRRLAISATLASLPVVVLADVNLPTGTPVTLRNIEDILNTIANWLIVVGVVIAVIYIVWGGILWMTSKDEPGKVAAGKHRVLNGIIGAAIVLGVGVILRTVSALVTRTFFQ